MFRSTTKVTVFSGWSRLRTESALRPSSRSPAEVRRPRASSAAEVYVEALGDKAGDLLLHVHGRVNELDPHPGFQPVLLGVFFHDNPHHAALELELVIDPGEIEIQVDD